MLSWTPLTSRYQVVVFLRELLAAAGFERPDVLLQLFHQPEAGPRPADLAGYRPTARSASSRSAIYQANLLIVLLCFGPVRGSEFVAASGDCVPAWQRLAHLWRAHCEWTEWSELIRTVRVRKVRLDGGRDLIINLELAFDIFPDVSYPRDWWYSGEGPDPSEALMVSHFAFLCQAGGDRLQNAVAGMRQAYHSSTEVGPYGRTFARALIELRLDGNAGEERVECYRDAMFLIDRDLSLGVIRSVDSVWQLVLAELRRDIRRLPALFTPLARDVPDFHGQLSTVNARLQFAVLVVEEMACWDDLHEAFGVVRRALHGLLPHGLGGPALYPDYLRLWVAYLEAGLDPMTQDPRWNSSDPLVRADLAHLASSHPGLLVRIVRAVARTGNQGVSLASRIAAAVTRLPAAALNQLTEAEVAAVAAYGSEQEGAEAFEAWRAARERVRLVGP